MNSPMVKKNKMEVREIQEIEILFEVLPMGRKLGRKRGRLYFVFLNLSGSFFSYFRWYDRITYYTLALST